MSSYRGITLDGIDAQLTGQYGWYGMESYLSPLGRGFADAKGSPMPGMTNGGDVSPSEVSIIVDGLEIHGYAAESLMSNLSQQRRIDWRNSSTGDALKDVTQWINLNRSETRWNSKLGKFETKQERKERERKEKIKKAQANNKNMKNTPAKGGPLLASKGGVETKSFNINLNNVDLKGVEAFNLTTGVKINYPFNIRFEFHQPQLCKLNKKRN